LEAEPRSLSDLNAGLSVIMDIGRGEGAKRSRDCSLGVCRILESVSLWSNEEARSTDKIIGWVPVGFWAESPRER